MMIYVAGLGGDHGEAMNLELTRTNPWVFGVGNWPRLRVLLLCPSLAYAAKVHFAWQARHLEHVMIVFVWPAQHFQQLRIAWQEQHLEHVMIFSCGQRNIFSSQGSFCVAGAALEARYDQKVACGCSETCNRNVLRAFKEIRNITFSVFHLSWLYSLSCC